MRESEFLAVLDRKLVEVTGIDFTNNHVYVWDGEEDLIIPMNETKLLRYIHLKDKTGKRVYEGDILKVDEDWEKWGFASGFVGYVVYDKGSYKLKEGKMYAPAYRLDETTEEGTTIIGNIHVNDSLLEG